jgi:hypothetical protein
MMLSAVSPLYTKRQQTKSVAAFVLSQKWYRLSPSFADGRSGGLGWLNRQVQRDCNEDTPNRGANPDLLGNSGRPTHLESGL